MGRASSRRPSRLRKVRRLAAGLCLAGSSLLGAGCASTGWLTPQAPPSCLAGRPPQVAFPPSAQEVVPASHSSVSPGPQLPPPSPAPAKELPITLDTVLRLAEQQNPRIGLAREKLGSSQASAESALGAWLPTVHAGFGYFRHEGGIQDFQGNLVHSSYGSLFPALQIQSAFDVRETTFGQVDAERKVWQNKAELSQVSNEILLDAAQTYVDLLTARRGEAVINDLQRLDRDVLERAEGAAKTDQSARVLMASIQSVLSGREHAQARLRQQGNAASAKLVYLLGLPPGTSLVPVDPVLVPVELVDASLPTQDLVAQVMTNGPGVRELEGIIAAIQGGIDELSGCKGMLPCVLLSLCEGPFGAGRGAGLAWDNRFDFGLQVRWNLTALASAQEQRRQAQSQIHQVQLTRQEVQGKLALGVQEAKDSILGGREQMGLAAQQIRHASEAYRLTERRLQVGAANATLADIFQALRGLEQGYLSHISAINSHNKGQVRLMVLLGGGCPAQPAAAPGYAAPGVPTPPVRKPAEKVEPEGGSAQQLPPPRDQRQLPTLLPLSAPK